jgi:hypothetical protein
MILPAASPKGNAVFIKASLKTKKRGRLKPRVPAKMGQSSFTPNQYLNGSPDAGHHSHGI